MYQSDGLVKGEHDPNHPKEWHRLVPTTDGQFVFLHCWDDGREPEQVGRPHEDHNVIVSVVGTAHRYAQHGGRA